MHDISVFDAALDLKNTLDYQLFLQILPDGFSYAIYNKLNNTFIGLKHFYFGENFPKEHYAESTNGILSGEEILTKRYKQVRVLFYSCQSTLVPEPLFMSEKTEEYFNLNFGNKWQGKLQVNKFENIPVSCIFNMDTDVLNVLQNKFSDFSIYHQSKPQVDIGLLMKKNNLNEPEIHVCFNTDFFDLYILHNNNLKFYNSFNYDTKEDVVYYILYAFEQLKMNPEKTVIEMSGDIEYSSEIYSWLKKYIRQVNLSDKPEDEIFSPVFKSIPDHYFVHLFNLAKCAL